MADPLAADSEQSESRDTQASMLSGLRQSKDEDHRKNCGNEFARKYRPLSFAYFKRKGLGDHDADDLANDLILQLLKAMENFRYDPTRRFRNYWITAAGKIVFKFLERNGKRRTVSGELLQDVVSREDLQQRLEGQFDLDLLAEAECRVKATVSPRNWQIYEELTTQPKTVEELSESLGIDRAVVDTAKWRVIRAIKQKVKELEERGY